MKINRIQQKNNITFQSKLIKNNGISKAFEYNKELLNKNEFTKVASFCRGLESIFERGPKDTVYNLSSEIQRSKGWYKGVCYSVTVNLGGLSSLAERKNHHEACKLEKQMLSEAVAKIGESNIKTDCDKFADKMFEEHVFQKLNECPEEILSEYGKKLWRESKSSYNRIFLPRDYDFNFANIFKAQDELKTINDNDIEKINKINKKIKAEIREIIDSDYLPIYYGYKRTTPQVLNKTKKDFRQFYTGESEKTYEFQNLLKEYNTASQNQDDMVQARVKITKFLNNWMNLLENNKNLIDSSSKIC